MIARLRSVVSRLDESTHQLLIKLYWENHKEMELAREMQVTRQAINKRKKFAVQRIGRLLGAEPQEVNGTNS